LRGWYCRPGLRHAPARFAFLPGAQPAVNKTALLALDLQRDFLRTDGRMSVGAINADIVIATANRMLSHAEFAGWKLILIKNDYRKADRIGNFIRKGAAIEGSIGAEIDPRIRVPAAAAIFTKSKPDAFTNPKLAEIFKGEGIQNLVILGVMAEGCVRATVKSAIRTGFSVTVISDGVASSRDFLKGAGLESMKKAGATLKECAEILEDA
jgi:nicotinamidase-related amidase